MAWVGRARFSSPRLACQCIDTRGSLSALPDTFCGWSLRTPSPPLRNSMRLSRRPNGPHSSACAAGLLSPDCTPRRRRQGDVGALFQWGQGIASSVAGIATILQIISTVLIQTERRALLLHLRFAPTGFEVGLRVQVPRPAAIRHLGEKEEGPVGGSRGHGGGTYFSGQRY